MKSRISKSLFFGIWFFMFTCLLIAQLLVSLRISGLCQANASAQTLRIPNDNPPWYLYTVVVPSLVVLLGLVVWPRTRVYGRELFRALIGFGILVLGFGGVLWAAFAEDIQSYSSGLALVSGVLLVCVVLVAIGALRAYVLIRKQDRTTQTKESKPPPLPKVDERKGQPPPGN
jgi:hypothetical protein